MSGLSSLCNVTVIVLDLVPPEVTCPKDITVISSTPSTKVEYNGFVKDNADNTIVEVFSIPSGSIFSAQAGKQCTSRKI